MGRADRDQRELAGEVAFAQLLAGRHWRLSIFGFANPSAICKPPAHTLSFTFQATTVDVGRPADLAEWRPSAIALPGNFDRPYLVSNA